MKCLVYIQSGFDVYHSWIILTTDNVHCSLSWLTGHCLVAAAGPGIILSPSSATPLGSQFIPFPVSAAPDHCLLLFIEFVFVQFLPLSDETGLSETETKRRGRAQPWLGAGWYDLTPASLLMKHWDQARSGDSLCITQRGKGIKLYLVSCVLKISIFHRNIDGFSFGSINDSWFIQFSPNSCTMRNERSSR